jgi:hypothetical protein
LIDVFSEWRPGFTSNSNKPALRHVSYTLSLSALAWQGWVPQLVVPWPDMQFMF